MRRSTLALIALLLPLFSRASGPVCPLRATGSERLRRVAGRSFEVGAAWVREVRMDAAYCTGCHDATVAAPVDVTFASHRSDLAAGASHPVDVSYPTADPGYRAVSELDERLVLDEGRVTCRTCHGGTDPASRFLSVEPERLCLECHRK